MTENFSPSRWANTITTILNAAYSGSDRFPVRIKDIAKNFSLQKYPDDPISMIAGDNLPGFDGALVRSPEGQKGWGIGYNNAIRSAGRINFTLAHEFGHYLLHRQQHPNGIECSQQDMVRWSEYREAEQQANEFAAGLLMPLDDFRRQISATARPSLDQIGNCAERYDVSLIAATLRWLQYTSRRSILVVSRDGFILWARSSTPALRTGAFFRTANRPPVAIPNSALCLQTDLLETGKGARAHDAHVWLSEPCEEIALVSDHYDFSISLLHLGEAPNRFELEEEPEEDVVDRMNRRASPNS